MHFLCGTNPLLLKIPNRERISAIIFHICFGMYLLCNMYHTTTLEYTNKDLDRLLIKICWFCVYLSIANILFLCDYSIKQLLCQIIILGVFFTSYHISRYYFLFQGIAIAFSARHVNWRRLAVVNVCIYFSLLLSVIICNRLGVFPSLNFTRDDIIRTDMGFSHPNVYGAYLMEICLAWMIMRFDKLKYYDYIFFVLVAVYAWIGPNSRTSAMMIMAMMILLPVFKYGRRWIGHRIGKIALSLCYPAGFIFSLISVNLYSGENKVFLAVDELLSGRIALANAFMKDYSPTLLGQRMKLVSSAKSLAKGIPAAILDNAYIHLYLRLGILTALLFMGIMALTVYRVICKKYYNYLLALLLFSVYGLSENRIDRIFFNFALLTAVFLFRETKPAGNLEQGLSGHAG